MAPARASSTIFPEDEFRSFLALPACSPQYEDGKKMPANPAAWWMAVGKSSCPNVFKLYRQWCCSPGAATSVERLWSNATRIDDRLRCRIQPEMMTSLLFFKKNMA